MTPPPNGEVTNKPEDDPLGGMDPMAWLESLARRQGANPEELITAADLDVPLPSLDATPETPSHQTPVPTPPPPAAQPSADDPLGGADPMAWLESLARRQGANPDELTTAADIDVPLPAMDATSAPPPAPPTSPTPAAQPSADDPLGGVDPMAWLESLARRQGANPEELTTAADIDVPLPPPDAVIEERGYTDFDPFSASTLSPSARALEQPPSTARSDDSTAWLDALSQTSPSQAASSEESDPMAWLASFGEPSPYDLGDLSAQTPALESMTPDAALSWLDSLSADAEPAAAPPSAPQDLSPLEAGGLSNDPQEVQAWLTEQLGSLMQTREAETDLAAADLPPAEPSAELPDWLSEAIVDPTLPAARGTLDPDIKLPTPPADLPTWLLEPSESDLDLTFSEDFIPPQAPLPQVPEAAVELDPAEIERLIKPSSPEEVDDLAEYFNEEYDRRRAGDETIPLWYLEALQRAESVLAEPSSPPPAFPEPEPLAETLAQGDVPSWLLEMQPEETPSIAPTPSVALTPSDAQLPEELSWLEALAEGLPEETPPAVVEPPAQPVVVEPVPPSERPAWLAPTGKLDPSVVERYEQERAARPAEPLPAPKAEPQPAPTAPPARRVASLQQARQQVVQGQVLPALESYQALIDNMENLEEVRADLRQLVEQHPKEPKVRRLLGDTHMRLGDLQAALDAYLTALKEL